jgi:hypothetical protein
MQIARSLYYDGIESEHRSYADDGLAANTDAEIKWESLEIAQPQEPAGN